MPLSKKPRQKAQSKTEPMAAPLPDRQDDPIRRAQEVMYDAWDARTARDRLALARKALKISPSARTPTT